MVTLTIIIMTIIILAIHSIIMAIHSNFRYRSYHIHRTYDIHRLNTFIIILAIIYIILTITNSKSHWIDIHQ